MKQRDKITHSFTVLIRSRARKSIGEVYDSVCEEELCDVAEKFTEPKKADDPQMQKEIIENSVELPVMRQY